MSRLIWGFVCPCNIVLNITQCCCSLTYWSLMEFLKMWWSGKWQKRECINTLTILVTPPPCQTKRKKNYIISTEVVVFLVLCLGTSKRKEKKAFSSQWTQSSDQDMFWFLLSVNRCLPLQPFLWTVTFKNLLKTWYFCKIKWIQFS